LNSFNNIILIVFDALTLRLFNFAHSHISTLLIKSVLSSVRKITVKHFKKCVFFRLCVFVMVVGYYIKPVIRPQTFVFLSNSLEQLIIVNTVFIISLEPRVAHLTNEFY
jgi:hypothetical protein